VDVFFGIHDDKSRFLLDLFRRHSKDERSIDLKCLLAAFKLSLNHALEIQLHPKEEALVGNLFHKSCRAGTVQLEFHWFKKVFRLAAVKVWSLPLDRLTASNLLLQQLLGCCLFKHGLDLSEALSKFSEQSPLELKAVSDVFCK
jgi:hypothetical protein